MCTFCFFSSAVQAQEAQLRLQQELAVVVVGELEAASSRPEAASSRPEAGKSYQELAQAARLVEVEATEQVETEFEVGIVSGAESSQGIAIEVISFKTLIFWDLAAKLFKLELDQRCCHLPSFQVQIWVEFAHVEKLQELQKSQELQGPWIFQLSKKGSIHQESFCEPRAQR